MTYAVRHGTPSLHLDDSIAHLAASLPLDSFMRNPEDIMDIKEMCQKVKEEILVECIPAFQHLQNEIEIHWKQRFSEEMRKKSEHPELGSN